MELYKNDILKIFSENFKFPITDTPLGAAVQMDPISAFLFSNITGAGYFDNPTFLFSPKGTQKILREAFQYNLVTGMFNGVLPFYTPVNLKQKRPYVFNNKKKIIVKEFYDECELAEELEDEYDKIIELGESPTDYIILRVEASKTGNGMEPFLEYLACETFKRRGYIVENQIPLTATVGSPDFGGYKIKNSDRGFHINELSLLRLTKNFDIAEYLEFDSFIVGEAKTATTVMEKQLKKYLNTGLFSKGYELHPDKIKPSCNSFGILNINDEYRVCCKEPTEEAEGNPSFSLNEYKSWLENYIKFYLFANFTENEFESIVFSGRSLKNASTKEMIDKICGFTVKEITDMIKGCL